MSQEVSKWVITYLKMGYIGIINHLLTFTNFLGHPSSVFEETLGRVGAKKSHFSQQKQRPNSEAILWDLGLFGIPDRYPEISLVTPEIAGVPYDLMKTPIKGVSLKTLIFFGGGGYTLGGVRLTSL